jgi:putative hemolysin
MMILILLLALAFLVTAIYSGSETGLYAFNPLKMQGTTALAERTKNILKRRDSIVIACLIGTNIGIEGATICFGLICEKFERMDAQLLHVAELVILVPALFLLGEIIPKAFCSAKANFILPKLTGFLWISSIVFSPFILVMKLLVKMMSAGVGNPDQVDYTQSRQRLKWVLQDAESDLSSEQSRMVRNVLGLQDRQVASIMRPLKSVEMISVNSDIEEVKKQFLDQKINYLLVYENERENVLGVVYVSPILLAENGKIIRDFLVAIPEVSVKEDLTDALNLLKKDNLPVARVISDNGNLLGMVFTRKIIEEVVGDMPIW